MIDSNVRERILEHRFLADLGTLLWTRGHSEIAIARSEVDAFGYDVIVEFAGIVRQVQLKSSTLGSRTARQSISDRLARTTSGCVIWMVANDQLQIDHYRWYGASPGDPMVPLIRPVKGRRLKENNERKDRPFTHALTSRQCDRVKGTEAIAAKLFGVSRIAPVDAQVAAA